MIVSPATMAKLTLVPFEAWTRVGPMNHVLHGVQNPYTYM